MYKNKGKSYARRNNSVITTNEFIDSINKYIQSINNVTNFQTFVNEAPQIVEYIKKQTNLHNIQMKYEYLSCLENNNGFRFILSAKKHAANYNSELVRYSNGMVFLVTPNGVTVICKPARDPVLSTNMTKNKLDSSLYDIYKIQEGTTVNLYYYDEWIVSTRSSFDMRNTTWRGDKSYGVAVNEALAKYNFSYDSLDKNVTYTIGFKHPSLHPFDYSDEPSCWFITASSPEHEMPGIPLQEKVEPDIDIFNSAESALDNYLSGVRPYVLGYILRTKDESATGRFSDIIVESTLLTQIRKLIYDSGSKSPQYAQNFKDINYVILESYMDFRRRDLFINLFPQYGETFDQYTELFNEVVEKLTIVLKRYEEIYKSAGQKSKIVIDFSSETAADKLVHFYYPIIRSMITTNSAKLIKDMIVCPKYAQNVYKILNQ